MLPFIGVYLFFMALIFAFIEIEIEGKYGWAEKLPTWYSKSGFGKLWSSLNSKRPLTGYHLFAWIFALLIFHQVFLLGVGWSLSKELQILAFIAIFWVTEDFLWFVFNPHYTLKNFKKDKIWWHRNTRWVFGLFPVDYLNAVILSLLFFYISSFLLQNISVFYGWIFNLIAILVLVFVSAFFAPLYRRLYWKLRKKDERDKVEIFH